VGAWSGGITCGAWGTMGSVICRASDSENAEIHVGLV
jgi:hypothetical protein